MFARAPVDGHPLDLTLALRGLRHLRAAALRQGRYKALHVEPGHALAQVAHYIHLNPVRAKVVTAERIGEFRWSSLALFPSKQRPAEFEPETILAESGGLADTPAGWRRYVDHLGVLAEEEAKLREEKFGRMSRGWVIGSAEFRKEMREELAGSVATRGRFELLGADAEGHRAMQEALWEERLVAAAKALGSPLGKLPDRKSDPQKVRIAAEMRATTSATNRWLAGRLKMGEPASVSQYVRRLRLAGGTEVKEFREAVKRVSA